MQALRRRRRPVRAAELAGELGVSLRTVYRDVATLVGQGAPIEGEAGLGYILRPGFFLPPLMFGEDELDALILGLRLVGERADPDLVRGASDALAKIVAVLPPEQESAPDTSGLLAGPVSRRGAPSREAANLAAIRLAVRDERKLRLRYTDKRGAASTRVVWPVALGFFEASEVLVAWCETRTAFRHFRLDRIAGADSTGERYPTRRRLLLAEWRQEEIERSG